MSKRDNHIRAYATALRDMLVTAAVNHGDDFAVALCRRCAWELGEVIADLRDRGAAVAILDEAAGAVLAQMPLPVWSATPVTATDTDDAPVAMTRAEVYDACLEAIVAAFGGEQAPAPPSRWQRARAVPGKVLAWALAETEENWLRVSLISVAAIYGPLLGWAWWVGKLH